MCWAMVSKTIVAKKQDKIKVPRSFRNIDSGLKPSRVYILTSLID
jgi:hypothetical protein